MVMFLLLCVFEAAVTELLKGGGFLILFIGVSLCQ